MIGKSAAVERSAFPLLMSTGSSGHRNELNRLQPAGADAIGIRSVREHDQICFCNGHWPCQIHSYCSRQAAENEVERAPKHDQQQSLQPHSEYDGSNIKSNVFA